MNRSTLAHRSATVLAIAGAAVMASAGLASAHVSVNPNEADQGGYAKIAFRVPNERDNASTTKVEVNLPKEHPVSSVSTQPLTGWKVTVEKSKLDKPIKTHSGDVNEAVSKITWTADKGSEIKPAQFQEFNVSLGKLPEDSDSMVFKTLQTYSNGEVVRWIDMAQDGAEEPEHPAPVLTLVKPAAEGAEAAASAPAAPAASAPAAPAAATTGSDTGSEKTETVAASSSDSAARTLGVLGIVIGVIGAGLGVLGLRRKSGSAA